MTTSFYSETRLMEFKYAPIRSILQPHLQVREEMKITAEEVGLYDRDNRLTEFDKGIVGLSNFSLYWYTKEVMIGFYCDQITKIENIPGLFTRHPKIKVYFNESSILQLSFRGKTNVVNEFYFIFQQVLTSKEWQNRGGIHHLINKKEKELQLKKELVTDAFSSLDSLLLKMNELMDLAKSKNHVLQDLSFSEDINETVYNIIQLQLKENQMVNLLQLYYLVNKSNQYHSISPKELTSIILKLKKEEKIVYRELNGNAIVQSLEFDDDMFVSKLLSLFDQYDALNIQLIALELQVSYKTALFMVEWVCEHQTAIVKDDCLEETLYYKNKLLINNL